MGGGEGGGGGGTVCLPDDVLATDIGHCIQELACYSNSMLLI